MKNTYSALYRFVCIILFTNFTLVLRAMPLSDTTNVKLENAVSDSLILNNLNSDTVVYPKSLASHKELSLDYVQKFSEKRRDYLIRTFKKGKNFFPKIVAVLKRFQLPQELKVLIALESGFNANALSSAGAMGYWQIMDDVAREYGLRIKTNTPASSVKNKNKIIDDRTNFSKSTLAAAKYLSDRGRNLNNDLLLIVASYNWGVGNVWQAMKRTGKSNPDFWDIKKYLPAETKAYVMNFITLNVIFNNYNKFVKNELKFTPDTEEDVETAEESMVVENTGVLTN